MALRVRAAKSGTRFCSWTGDFFAAGAVFRSAKRGCFAPAARFSGTASRCLSWRVGFARDAPRGRAVRVAAAAAVLRPVAAPAVAPPPGPPAAAASFCFSFGRLRALRTRQRRHAQAVRDDPRQPIRAAHRAALPVVHVLSMKAARPPCLGLQHARTPSTDGCGHPPPSSKQSLVLRLARTFSLTLPSFWSKFSMAVPRWYLSAALSYALAA